MPQVQNKSDLSGDPRSSHHSQHVDLDVHQSGTSSATPSLQQQQQLWTRDHDESKKDSSQHSGCDLESDWSKSYPHPERESVDVHRSRTSSSTPTPQGQRQLCTRYDEEVRSGSSKHQDKDFRIVSPQYREREDFNRHRDGKDSTQFQQHQDVDNFQPGHHDGENPDANANANPVLAPMAGEPSANVHGSHEDEREIPEPTHEPRKSRKLNRRQRKKARQLALMEKEGQAGPADANPGAGDDKQEPGSEQVADDNSLSGPDPVVSLDPPGDKNPDRKSQVTSAHPAKTKQYRQDIIELKDLSSDNVGEQVAYARNNPQDEPKQLENSISTSLASAKQGGQAKPSQETMELEEVELSSDDEHPLQRTGSTNQEDKNRKPKSAGANLTPLGQKRQQAPSRNLELEELSSDHETEQPAFSRKRARDDQSHASHSRSTRPMHAKQGGKAEPKIIGLEDEQGAPPDRLQGSSMAEENRGGAGGGEVDVVSLSR